MDNADLEKLKVSTGRLVPRFKPSVSGYSLTLNSDAEEVKLTPLTSDGGASYIIKGSTSGKAVRLEEGQTAEVEVVVTAEDGKSTKTYSISIRRLSADDACLSSLEVVQGILRPSFSPFIQQYECYLPCGIDRLEIKAKTQDAAMKLSMKDGSPVGTVTLSPGHMLLEISVVSVRGSTSTTYTIAACKARLPRALQLKSKEKLWECAICCGVSLQPCKIRGSQLFYCRSCLEEQTRTSKVDPFTGRLLEEGWMQVDFSTDAELAAEMVTCPTGMGGTVEGPLLSLGPQLREERKKAAEKGVPTTACQDCSKKVPSDDITLHQELLCTAKHPSSLPKQEVKARPWEKRLVDESCGKVVQELIQKASQSETSYLKALSRQEPGKSAGGRSPLDHLQKAAQCYASALKLSPRELQAHIGLGLAMEEFFYAEDLFGLKKEVAEGEEEGEAERSSREEEFLAICQLHRVAATAPAALQLRAVEAEYHGLREAGQTHKAEHVQQLHAWRSKKLLQASRGSYAVDMESPLYKAKLKLQDAVTVMPSDATACYHAGRISLLLGEREEALLYLQSALGLKPTLPHIQLCLALALPPAMGGHAKLLLRSGLLTYLSQEQERNEEAEPERAVLKELHSKILFRSTNTLVMDAFLRLAELGGCEPLGFTACLLCVTPATAEASIQHRADTYQRLLWSALSARAMLLRHLHQHKSKAVLGHCRQLSALLASCGLHPTDQLRALQMEVFQLGVVLQPASSEALCHLGNGQLVLFEASNEHTHLREAELSFRASIAVEGQPLSSPSAPAALQEQGWWKQRSTPAPLKSSADPATATKTTPTLAGAKGPAAVSRVRQPAGRPPVKATTATSTKTQPSGSRGPAKPTPQAQAGARKPAGPTARQPAGPAVRQPAGPAARQPAGSRARAPAGRAGQGGGGAQLKGPATLGELKSSSSATAAARKPQQGGAKGVGGGVKGTGGGAMESVSSPPKAEVKTIEAEESGSVGVAGGTVGVVPAELNQKSYQPRLGLARALAKNTDSIKISESHSFYREVIKLAPEIHDAYIELGEMLSGSNAVAAVDVYAAFPFSDPPSFDDAYLHGEIVRLLMEAESFEDPRLCSSMISMGRALGIAVLEHRVTVLEAKFKTTLLKKVYAGVHGKPVDDPDLAAFFKFRVWT